MSCPCSTSPIQVRSYEPPLCRSPACALDIKNGKPSFAFYRVNALSLHSTTRKTNNHLLRHHVLWTPMKCRRRAKHLSFSHRLIARVTGELTKRILLRLPTRRRRLLAPRYPLLPQSHRPNRGGVCIWALHQCCVLWPHMKTLRFTGCLTWRWSPYIQDVLSTDYFPSGAGNARADCPSSPEVWKVFPFFLAQGWVVEHALLGLLLVQLVFVWVRLAERT